MPRKFPGTRVEWKNGAYRYRRKTSETALYPKTWHKIGLTETDVYHFLAGQNSILVITILQDALQKYEQEVVPKKAFKSQSINRVSIKRLIKALGHIPVEVLELPQIIQYRDLIGANFGKGAANSDLEVLSHCYSMMIQWGRIKNWEHPMRGNRVKFPKIPRDRYVTHDEILDLWRKSDAFWQLYLPLKLKTSLDQKTICSMQWSDVTEEGVYYKRQKLSRYDNAQRPKMKIILWDDELKLVFKLLKYKAKNTDYTRSYVLQTKNGGPYLDKNNTAAPLKLRFQRLKKRLGITDYTEHDLRAKSLSDEESESVAALRADHNQSITNRVYRRKAEPVMPLSLEAIGLGEMIDGLKNLPC